MTVLWTQLNNPFSKLGQVSFKPKLLIHNLIILI